MYLIVIAWMYVVLMMSVAEATNTTGTVLGAIVTFVLYGLVPVALVVYLMGAPARSKAIKKRAAEELAAVKASKLNNDVWAIQGSSGASQPDAGSHAPSSVEAVATHASITPMRKEP